MGASTIHILLLSRYGALGASSRVRFLQFLPYLRSSGFSVDVCTLLDDSYSLKFQEGKSALPSIFAGYTRRLASLLKRNEYDLVWLEKEFLPWVPTWIESLLLDPAIPYVADYDDPVFHRYDMHDSALVRQLLGTKIDDTMRAAKIVVAGNDYLAQRAIKAGAKRVEIVPSVLDVTRHSVSPGRDKMPFCVGWIGQRSTALYLAELDRPLRALYADGPMTFRVVGAPNWDSTACPLESRPWSAMTEATEIQSMDVGVMPLLDDKWARGKCGYKLIQYMASGKPVVASPVGVNTQIVEHGVTGFLARSETEWLSSLRALRDDPALRRRMGAAGRAKVESQYSLQVTAPRLASILRSAAGAE